MSNFKKKLMFLCLLGICWSGCISSYLYCMPSFKEMIEKKDSCLTCTCPGSNPAHPLLESFFSQPDLNLRLKGPYLT